MVLQEHRIASGDLTVREPARYVCTDRLGQLRDELLNRELFLNLEEVRWVIDGGWLDGNRHWLHGA